MRNQLCLQLIRKILPGPFYIGVRPLIFLGKNAKTGLDATMHMDIIDLRDFYASPLGELSTNAISMGLTALWEPLAQERLLGIGYATPYLEKFSPDAERTMAFMPAAQGAVNWPQGKPSATALVFDEELPLPDSAIDRILMMHSLEHSENPLESLREMWRVLAPGGRIVIVVPNRRGVWARFEHTPFGAGRPYSRGQLLSLLRSAMFSPLNWSAALYFPPSKRQWVRRFSALFERTGRKISPAAFPGVIIVEATKQLYQGLPANVRQSRRVFVPVLAPQGVGASSVMSGSGTRKK